MRKGIKILGKVLSWIIVAIVGLPVAAALLLNVGTVQPFAVRKATALLSRKLETTVSIDRIRLRGFSRLVAEGLDVYKRQIWRNRIIVEDSQVENPNQQISISDARKLDETYEVGEEVADEIKLDSFGRRAVLSLRQNLASRILDLEKANLFEKYSERVGEIITGEVYQVWKKEILVLDDEDNEMCIRDRSRLRKRCHGRQA